MNFRQYTIIAASFLILTSTVARGQAMHSTLSPAQIFNRFHNDSFPIMQLETPDSSMFNTASLSGKTVYVDFWFTTCPPCISEIPYAKALQQYFSADTNIVFVNICIDMSQQKLRWRELVATKHIGGINLFYTRNKPQKINLLRQLGIDDFPMYLLLDDLKIIGHNAPRPSEKGLVQWSIYQASKHKSLAESYTALAAKNAESQAYLKNNWPAIEASQPVPSGE